MRDDGVIHIESGVSVFTGAGFVSLRWGRESGQLSPAEARLHALHVLEAAEAAESDAAVYAECVDGLGLDAPTAAQFLAALRRRRENGRKRR